MQNSDILALCLQMITLLRKAVDLLSDEVLLFEIQEVLKLDIKESEAVSVYLELSRVLVNIYYVIDNNSPLFEEVSQFLVHQDSY